jgi:DNA-directed RNA polymerase subunit RPC12/RpoP
MSYAIFELKCTTCGIEYAQLLPEEEEGVAITCPSCDDYLKKGKKLTGAEMISCGINLEAG